MPRLRIDVGIATRAVGSATATTDFPTPEIDHCSRLDTSMRRPSSNASITAAVVLLIAFRLQIASP